MLENPFAPKIRRPEDTDPEANRALIASHLDPEMAEAWDTLEEGSLKPSKKQEDDESLDLTPEERADMSEGRIEQLFHLERQYRRNKASLKVTGLIETLPSGKEGIIGIDGKEYPFPEIDAIRNELVKNREKYEMKAKQGFTRIAIVPFASPLKQKFDAYQSTLERHFKEGTLFAKGTKELPFTNRTKALDKMYVLDGYADTDTNGKMVYDPKQFTKENHGGRTKQELLDEASPFPGYRILLLEEDTTIPREGAGTTKGGRQRIEAGKSPNQYQADLKLPGYEHESMLTIDDWLVLSATNLEETNEVQDDYGNGTDSVSWNGGSFFPASGDVSGAFWDRDYRQADARGFGVGRRGPGSGVRPAVKVG